MTEHKTPAQLADDAAEAIRALNHATLSPRDGWEYPADAYSVVGNLGTLVMRLPQLLEQVTQHVEKLHQDGHVVADTGDTLERLYNLSAASVEAGEAAQKLRSALDEMHAMLSPLAYKA